MAVLIGLIAGFLIGSWLIPNHYGFGSIPLLFMGGGLGAVIGLLAALALIFRSSTRIVRNVSIFLLILNISIYSGLTLVSELDSPEQRHFWQPDLPEVSLKILDWHRHSIVRLNYESAQNQIEVVYSDGRQCAFEIMQSSAERVHQQIYQALRRLELSGMLIYPPPCQQRGTIRAEVELTIFEIRNPIVQARLPITNACFVDKVEMAELLHASQRLMNQFSTKLNCNNTSSTSN